MEAKVSLKDRLRRTRSAILSFGLQKQPTEKPDGYPYFRGPPSQRQSSVCERQPISKPVERELRNACYLLQRNIAHGVPSTDSNQNPEQQVVPNRVPSIRVRPQSSALPVVLQAACQTRDSAPPAPAPVVASAPAREPAQAPVPEKSVWRNARPYKEHNYDADPWHQWSGITIPTGPQGQVQSDSTSRIPSSSMKSARDMPSDMPFSSGETLVAGADSQQDRRAYVRVPADIQDDPESESNEEKEHEQKHNNDNNNDNSPPHLEGSSRLVRKKRMENLHESSVREGTATNITTTTINTSNDNSNTASVAAKSPTTSRPSAPRARYSWLPRTGIRPASTIETGSQRRAHDPVTVTMGSTTGSRTGMRRMVADDEEQARQHDLQEAVWEKMATGRISSRSKTRPMSTTAMAMGMDDLPSTKPTTTTSTTTATAAAAAAATVTVNRRTASQPLACRDTSHKHKSDFPTSVPVPEPGAGLLPAEKPEAGLDTFQQPMKRRSIMRKLAFLGFGKQKHKETPAVGYSQIVEAA